MTPNIKTGLSNLKRAIAVYSKSNGMRARVARSDPRSLAVCHIEAFGKSADAIRQLIVTSASCGVFTGSGCLGAAVRNAVSSGWLSKATAEKWIALFSAQTNRPPMYAIMHILRMLDMKGNAPALDILAEDIVNWTEGYGDTVAKRWVLAFYSRGLKADVLDDDNAI